MGSLACHALLYGNSEKAISGNTFHGECSFKRRNGFGIVMFEFLTSASRHTKFVYISEICKTNKNVCK